MEFIFYNARWTVDCCFPNLVCVCILEMIMIFVFIASGFFHNVNNEPD